MRRFRLGSDFWDAPDLILGRRVRGQSAKTLDASELYVRVYAKRARSRYGAVWCPGYQYATGRNLHRRRARRSYACLCLPCQALTMLPPERAAVSPDSGSKAFPYGR